MAEIHHGERSRSRGAEIKTRALALAAAQNRNPGDASGVCGAIDKLYGFLDLLDRKAGNLITLNSFLAALAGIFVFKPLGFFEAPSTSQTIARNTLHLCSAQTWILVSGGIALFASFFAIFAAVQIFRIRWGFMEHADLDPERRDFDKELGKLCNEAAFRQAQLGIIRGLTLTALVLTAAAVIIQAIQIFRQAV